MLDSACKKIVKTHKFFSNDASMMRYPVSRNLHKIGFKEFTESCQI